MIGACNVNALLTYKLKLKSKCGYRWTTAARPPVNFTKITPRLAQVPGSYCKRNHEDEYHDDFDRPDYTKSLKTAPMRPFAHPD
jgi:hypothetical protein